MITIIGEQKRINDKVHGLESGVMECPWCKGYLRPGQVYEKRRQTWKFDKWITPHRARYICGTCRRGVQYEM